MIKKAEAKKRLEVKAKAKAEAEAEDQSVLTSETELRGPARGQEESSEELTTEEASDPSDDQGEAKFVFATSEHTKKPADTNSAQGLRP